MIDKIKESGLALIAFAFVIFGIWQINVPIDEALISQLWALIISLIGAIIGGGAGARAYVAHKYEVTKK